MKKILASYVIFYVSLLQCCLFGQITIRNDSTYIFELNNGKTIEGKVKIIEPGVTYKVKTGKKWKIILDEDIEDYYYSFNKPETRTVLTVPNQHMHNYFLSPSSYSLKKGEAYYQNYFIVAQHFSFGVTDNITIGAGILPLFLSDDYVSNVAVSISPKISFKYKNGRGAFAAYSGLAGFHSSNNYLFSLGVCNTFGTEEKQLTIGIGTISDFFDEINTIHLFVNAMARVSNRWSFLIENQYCRYYENIFLNCSGFRYMPKRFALTFGIMTAIQYSNYIETGVVPWLGMAYKFR